LNFKNKEREMKISRIAKLCFFGSTLATHAFGADVTLTVEGGKTGSGQILASLCASNEMAQPIGERLRARKFDYPFEHKNYEGAGHSIFVGKPALSQPIDPTSMDAFMGGSAEANIAARADSWQRILHFLDTSLGAWP